MIRPLSIKTLAAVALMGLGCGRLLADGVTPAPSEWRTGCKCAIAYGSRQGEFTITRHFPGTNGRSVFLARDAAGNQAELVRKGGDYTATIRDIDGKAVTTLVSGGGAAKRRTVDPRNFKHKCAAETLGGKLDSASALRYFIPVDPPESDGTDNLLKVVDILVCYDKGARGWISDKGYDTVDFAEIQVARMNAVLENSGLLDDFRYRLVGVKELSVAIKDLGSNNDSRFKSALYSLDMNSQLSLKEDDTLRGVIEARYSTGADIAVVLTYTGEIEGTLGAAYGLLNVPDWDSAANLAYTGRRAFCVCEIAAVEANYVMVHEVGHVLGAGHPSAKQVNPNQIDCGPQLFDYSSAYIFDYDGNTYFTIMGYPWDGKGGTGFIPVAAFSSPELTFHDNGADTGVPMGVDGVCDNVKTLRNSYATVAKYRKHVHPLEGVAEITVKVLVDGNGDATGGGLYFEGENIVLRATAAKNNLFAGWRTIDGTGATNLLDVADFRASSCTVMAGTNDLTFVAVFVKKDAATDPVTAVTPLFDEDSFRAGVAFDLQPAFSAESLSKASFTVSGLPSGLKFTAGTSRLYGTPTKPGRFTMTVTAKNESGATRKEKITVTVANWLDATLPVDDAYGPFVPGVPVKIDFTGIASNASVSGLPTGMKWTKQTAMLSGAPAKPCTNTVIFTTSGHKASSTFIVGPYPVLTLKTFGNGAGMVSGAGKYAANKSITLRATQSTKQGEKSAFAGWYAEDGLLLSKSTACKYLMPAADVTVYGKFVTAEEDALSMETALGGWQLGTEAALSLTNLCGVAQCWPVMAEAESAVTVSVSGLPTGLKFSSKTMLVSGTPTVSAKLDSKTGLCKPVTAKIKATTVGKNVKTYPVDFYVMPLPEWAVGTFDGGGDDFTVSLTVQKTGKVSGKLMEGTRTWTLSAGSLATGEYDPEEGARDVSIDVIAKCSGQKPNTNTVHLSSSGLAGVATNEWLFAARSQWATTDYKALAKKMYAAGNVVVENEEGTFTFRVGTSGTMTVGAKFAGGYSASASVPLVATACGDGRLEALGYLHFPPNTARKFPGFDAVVSVCHDGDLHIQFNDFKTKEKQQ